MKIIGINSLVKKRIEIMAKALIPWIGFVRISNSGIVTLKTNCWSLRKTKLSVTDLCLHKLSNQIAHVATMHNPNHNYLLLFKETITIYLEPHHIDENLDVFEYLWDIYNRYCVKVPFDDEEPFTLIKPFKQNNLLPILSTAFFYRNRYGVNKIFKNFGKNTKKRSKLLNKIKIILAKCNFYILLNV